MGRRLPATLVEVKEQTRGPARKSVTAGPRPRPRISSLRRRRPVLLVWESIWAALVMSEARQSPGTGHTAADRQGGFLIRDWVRKSESRGLPFLAPLLKTLCLHLRALGLEGVDRGCPPGFPKRLYRFLVENLEVPGLLTFSTLARSLPENESVVDKSDALITHAETAFHPFRKVDGRVLREIRAYTAEGFRRGGVSPWGFPRLSTSAVSEVPGSRGGFSTFVGELWESEAELSSSAALVPVDLEGRGGHYSTFLGAFEPESTRSVLARPWVDGLTRPLMDAVESHRDDDGGFHPIDLARVEALEATAYAASKFRDMEEVVHRVVSVSERGYKLRVVTAPPGSLVAAGELARRALFPTVRDDPRLSVLRGGDPLQDLPPVPSDACVVSADLTKATDGFSHEAIRAVGLGMKDAGVPEEIYRTFVESLGAGNRTHSFSYKVSDLLPKRLSRRGLIRAKERLYLLGWDGASDALVVPVRRGSPMGTPCSFTLLCIVNGWACAHARHARICGDDLLGVFNPWESLTYERRVSAVGSSLSKPKTFRSKFAGTFCERFVVADGGTLSRVAIVPVKIATVPRKGAMGLLTPPSGLGFHFMEPTLEVSEREDLRRAWARTRRVFRTLWKDQRQAASSRGRFPEVLPVFGGLGHPGKGLHSVPAKVRGYLYSLFRCKDRGVWLDFHRALIPPPFPAGGSKGWAGLRYHSRLPREFVMEHIWLGGGELVRSKDLASFEALTTVMFFTLSGGRFHDKSRGGKLAPLTKLKPPRIELTGSYPTRTPWQRVLEDAEPVFNAGVVADEEIVKRIRRVHPSELSDALYGCRGQGEPHGG
jgi:hypothetical protein